MRSFLYHIQINIDFKNLNFYKKLFSFLNWSVIFETEDTLGFKSNMSGDIWFTDSSQKEQTNYDKIGMNHLSIRVGEQSDLDGCISYLKKEKIETLFDTPKHRSEFVDNQDETYYQVMFRSPDNILFELVYVGVRQS